MLLFLSVTPRGNALPFHLNVSSIRRIIDGKNGCSLVLAGEETDWMDLEESASSLLFRIQCLEYSADMHFCRNVYVESEILHQNEMSIWISQQKKGTPIHV